MKTDFLKSDEVVSGAGETFKVSNQKIVVNAFIEAKTGGDIRGYIPVTFTLVSSAMISSLNFAPSFVRYLSP